MANDNLSEVLFNAPICIELDAPEHEEPLGHPNNRPHHFTYTEIKTLTDKYHEDGWDERAVVVRSTCSIYARSVPSNWGFITALNTTMGNFGQVYCPIIVRWALDGSITRHWPEDLLLIHKSMPLGVLDFVLESQEEI
jgi:hypothetical protein